MANRKERIKEFYLMINERCYANGCDIAEDIIEELEEENKLTQWQPIKTAPKEAYILVVNNKLEHQPCVAFFGKCNINLPESWFSDIDSAINPLPFTPTHWMPLPTKPKE